MLLKIKSPLPPPKKHELWAIIHGRKSCKNFFFCLNDNYLIYFSCGCVSSWRRCPRALELHDAQFLDAVCTPTKQFEIRISSLPQKWRIFFSSSPTSSRWKNSNLPHFIPLSLACPQEYVSQFSICRLNEQKRKFLLLKMIFQFGVYPFGSF